MALWDNLQKAAAIKASKKLSIQDIKDFMNDLQKPDPNQRQFVMHTGAGGMRMLNQVMEVQVYLKTLKKLNFSREERKRLGEMIKSPDHENFQVAKIIIDNKLEDAKQYHNNK